MLKDVISFQLYSPEKLKIQDHVEINFIHDFIYNVLLSIISCIVELSFD